MSHKNSKITGQNYTPTVALLMISLVVIPVMSMASFSPGDLSFSLSAAASVLVTIFAGVSWRRSSQLSIPSIAVD